MLHPASTRDPQPTTKAEIARRNGALSRGPVTAAGKARSALNATRHGLSSRTVVLRGDAEAAELDALRAALLARCQPLDAAEAHWVEELVFVAWRQRRLRDLEEAVLAGAGTEHAPVLPSLATVMRYRARLDREWRRAGEELAALRQGRPAMADPSQLRWLADRIERVNRTIAAAAACPESPAAETTGEMPAAQGAEPENRVDEPPIGTNEPRHPVPPSPASGLEEPSPSRSLNRHQRRRLAALMRRAA